MDIRGCEGGFLTKLQGPIRRRGHAGQAVPAARAVPELHAPHQPRLRVVVPTRRKVPKTPHPSRCYHPTSVTSGADPRRGDINLSPDLAPTIMRKPEKRPETRRRAPPRGPNQEGYPPETQGKAPEEGEVNGGGHRSGKTGICTSKSTRGFSSSRSTCGKSRA